MGIMDRMAEMQKWHERTDWWWVIEQEIDEGLCDHERDDAPSELAMAIMDDILREGGYR
jgi:hypothetical protein